MTVPLQASITTRTWGARIRSGSPNGTVYICEFSGAFTAPEQVDGCTYSVHVQSLEYAAPDTESIADGIRWITAGPYGLDGVDEVLIYLPGHPTADIPEEVLHWIMSARDDIPDTLPFYALNNVNGQQGFYSDPQ